MEAKSIIFSMLMKCVIPENIHTSPIEGTFLRPSPPLWKFQLSFIHFFKCFGLTEPPTPKEIPIPSVWVVWIFSGTVQCVKTCVFHSQCSLSLSLSLLSPMYISYGLHVFSSSRFLIFLYAFWGFVEFYNVRPGKLNTNICSV